MLDLLVHSGEEAFFALKMVVHRPFGDAGLDHDLVDGGAWVPMLPKEGSGGVHQGFSGRGSLGGPAFSSSSGIPTWDFDLGLDFRTHGMQSTIPTVFYQPYRWYGSEEVGWTCRNT